MRKELRGLIAHYQKQGWTIEKTRHGHLKWTGPNGELTYSGSTPSDWRALKNIEARVRRAMKEAAKKRG